MKKTILTLALLATAATTAHANYGWTPPDKPSKPEPTKPEPKTPEPKAPEPKAPEVKTPAAPASPPAPSRTPPQSRSEGTRDADNLCTRWPTMFFCDRP